MKKLCKITITYKIITSEWDQFFSSTSSNHESKELTHTIDDYYDDSISYDYIKSIIKLLHKSSYSIDKIEIIKVTVDKIIQESFTFSGDDFITHINKYLKK